MRMKTVTVPIEYLIGYLRYGHFEVEINGDEWYKMNEQEKEEYVREYGEIIIDGVKIEGFGPLVMDEAKIR